MAKHANRVVAKSPVVALDLGWRCDTILPAMRQTFSAIWFTQSLLESHRMVHILSTGVDRLQT